MRRIILKIRNFASAIKGTYYLHQILPIKHFLKLIVISYKIKGCEDDITKDNLYKDSNDVLADYCTNILLKDFDCKFPIIESSRNTGNEPIWVCWLQGRDSLPELNKLCLKSIERFSNHHPVIFIDSNNVHNYITIPDNIKQLYNDHLILPAIYADYIRCSLLANHGGLWLDSTILLTDNIPEFAFQTEFYSIKSPLREHWSVSYHRWASFIMGTTKEAHFFKHIQTFFEYYLSLYNVNFSYLMIDFFFETVYQKNGEFRKYIDTRPCTNPQIHELRFCLGCEYNKILLKKFTENTSIFKLTYKMALPTETANGQETLYKHLLDIYTNFDENLQ